MAFQDAGSLDLFFSLLRSGLYGTPIPEAELPDHIDWKPILTLAKKQAVLGIIIDSVQLLPDSLRPSASITAKLNKYALSFIQSNIILDNAAARLASFLSQHGIDGVLLKGQGVARYYRMPQMRQSGDIDYYVGDKAFKKASALCREMLCDDKNECNQAGYHLCFNMGGVPVELHRLASKIFSPVRNRRFQQWTVEQLEHSPDRRTLSIGTVGITLPSCDFDALFIFYHAWLHYLKGGIGLRQLCDWAMIFHSHGADIDTERLKENIARFGLTKGWKLFACIAVNYLGVPAQKMPLYDPAYHKKSEKILHEILVGGNFGFYSEAFKRYTSTRSGIRNRLGKIRYISGYMFSLFPLIPVEATMLFFNRLFNGTLTFIKGPTRNSRI